MNARQTPLRDLAHTVSNVLNPFVIFTGLYVPVAFAEAGPSGALPYLGMELLAAGLVAGYVFSLMRRSRVGDFWISRRVERFFPALVLLAAFVGLLVALALSGAPENLYDMTLSMGLAAGAVAAVTLFWKASAHAAVAGHAATAGPLLLDLPGAVFVLAMPLVFWARVYAGAHTPLQAAAGAAVGAVFALVFLA